MGNRIYISAVEDAIEKVKEFFPKDSRIPTIFRTCIQDTLDRTIRVKADGSVYVITGDIPAMWLRDSSCQLHLFVRFADKEPELQKLMLGLIRKQTECILLDPYANAFNEEANGAHWAEDRTRMLPEIWERKYEIDSLCYPVQLSWLFWKQTGIISQFTDNWKRAAITILDTFHTEQFHESKSEYRFERMNTIFQDTLSRDGRGALVKEGTGLIFSGFRPSDDACVYGYLIPSNMFASVILGYISEIADSVYHDLDLAEEAGAFSAEVRSAVEHYGVMPGLSEKIYAYEVDGFGQYLFMDDANVPSLLAMPYFGYCDIDDPGYQATRKVLLSEANPYYYKGRDLAGIGSPHTPAYYVWDISLAIQGMTTHDLSEKKQMIQMMADHDAGTNMMHESIDVRNQKNYTRPWFSWANSMFCELVLDYMRDVQS